MNNIFLPLAALIVVALLVYVIVNAKKKDNHFDEMQLIKRAKGYKIGYFILLIGLLSTVYLMKHFSRSVKMQKVIHLYVLQ